MFRVTVYRWEKEHQRYQRPISWKRMLDRQCDVKVPFTSLNRSVCINCLQTEYIIFTGATAHGGDIY